VIGLQKLNGLKNLCRCFGVEKISVCVGNLTRFLGRLARTDYAVPDPEVFRAQKCWDKQLTSMLADLYEKLLRRVPASQKKIPGFM
jgi:hypothetical protein